ncbi:RNA polymerase I-specific transcription initiation factor RRN3-like [Paramacrobiotus metropolitanus]|uniref:RNA polymerase I-specific transcription initiation factor RRN3-like n=1 Tax=Paramacrobiotus metropolitanus TaxID=2943436 RepID=UPI002445D1C5|nr:RNA polymerase I-specific transcription initiation factor RRN3-like [Paramacrobiotus metropolitanus]
MELKSSDPSALTTLLSVQMWDPNFLEEVLRSHRSDKKQEFQHLLQYFRSIAEHGVSSDEDAQLSEILVKLQRLCPCLKQEHLAFVNALLACNFFVLSGETFEEFVLFITGLLTAQPFFVDGCLRNWVKRFRSLPPDCTLDLNREKLGTVDEKIRIYHNRVHIAIGKAVQLIPLCRPKLMHCIADGFPFRLRGVEEHFLYARNVLSLLDKYPANRSDILTIFLKYLAKLDADASPNELNDLEVDDDEDNEEDEVSTVNWIIEHPTAERLDLVLTLVLEYIEQLSAKRCVIPSDLEHFYRDTLPAFDDIIMMSQGLTHVQYIWFYMASLREQIAEALYQRLRQNILATNKPTVLRQFAVSYMCSFLARSKFVPLRNSIKFVDEMVQWIHKYITDYDRLPHVPDMEQVHRLFYVICENIFYLVTFRHEEIFAQSKGIAWFKALNFSRIISSNLNPLRYCKRVIRDLFASVTRNRGVLFCYTVIERNNRMMIFTAAKDAISAPGDDNPLNTSFPFEPYVLKRSKRFVTPLYRSYGEVILTELPEAETYRGLIADSDDSNQSRDSDEDDDSVIEDFSQTFRKPSRKRQLSENTT